MPGLEKQDPEIIEAKPTKELFVYMLVRDLTLRDAIGDLVDNSIDGAKRLRPDTDVSKSRNIDIQIKNLTFFAPFAPSLRALRFCFSKSLSERL